MAHAAPPPPLTGPDVPEHYHQGPHTDRQRIIAYVLLGAIFVILLSIALFVFRQGKSSVEANRRADQLIAGLTAAGLPAPSKDQIVRTLGDDGGAVCADPNNALKQGIQRLSMSNGAAGPGQRPVISPPRVVEGEKLIISIYCPDELAGFEEYVNQLKYANVVKD